jgi:hypothetical protein
MVRGVDRAMAEDRPEKQTVRELWVRAVIEAGSGSDEGAPLYLTLAGARGLDIERLIEEGLVSREENQAIAEQDQWKVVAVESNNSARLELKERFTGLRIVGENLKGMLHSTGPFTWPQGEKARYCRARVVNLDFNSSLSIERDAQGHYVLPTIQIITKIAELHLKAPALDWMLCLTCAAKINWPKAACEQVQAVLRENFKAEERFANDSRTVLGDTLYERLLADETVDMATLSESEQQALLMVFVPKRIVADTYHRGWKITTAQNLRYGGNRSGRMVTWLMHFTQDHRGQTQPRTLYSESLDLALAKTGSVGSDGQLREAGA